jgi:hypothetical protein
MWQQKRQYIFNLSKTTRQLQRNIVPVLSFAVIVPITPNFNDLVCYIRTGDVNAFKLALSTGDINISANNNQLIIEACNAGNIEIVKLLLNDPNVDPSAQLNKALFDACSKGRTNLEIIEMLIKHPKVDPSIGEILYAAATNSNWHVIDLVFNVSENRSIC